MAFDPTLPINNSLISSAELRNQFTGLKTLIDGRTTPLDVEGLFAIAVASGLAGLFDLSGLVISDPPAQSEVQTVVNKLNEVIGMLKAL